MTDDRPPRLLSDAQLRDLFDSDVQPILGGPARDDPRLLILGGPPGGGKTSSLPRVAQQLGMAAAARVEGDDIERLLPAFEPLAREYDVMEAIRRCDRDFDELYRMTLEEIRRLRRDVVLVGSYYLPGFTFDLIAGFTSDGYQAEAAYMAVHPARCELGVLHRHHLAMIDGIGYSFAVPPDFQQEVREGVSEVLTLAQRQDWVGALHIADRKDVLSARLGPDGVWAPPVDIRQAYEDHCLLPWDLEVREDFRRRRAEAGTTLIGPEWATRLANLDRLAAPMLDDVEPPPEAAAPNPRSQERATRRPHRSDRRSGRVR